MSYKPAEFREKLITEKGNNGHKISYDCLAIKYQVNKFYLWHIIKTPGYIPPRSVATKLDIELYASVIVIEGDVPNGAQVLRATRCVCSQYFISNHPRRKKCFICSPYRKRKE
jgi:hypothetical protein